MRIFDAHIEPLYNINMDTSQQISQKRKPVNLTIREDIYAEAKKLKINASKAAEAGIYDAVKKAKEQAWLEENRNAIQAHNERIEREGVLIPPVWMK